MVAIKKFINFLKKKSKKKAIPSSLINQIRVKYLITL